MDSVKVDLSHLSLKELRDIYVRACEWHRVEPASINSRRDHIDRIKDMATWARRGKRPKRMGRLGVGKFVEELLMKEVGRTDDGFPVGLSYEQIIDAVRVKFPESVCNARHIRWYANKMRTRDGVQPPVHRGMSKWGNREEDK